MTPVRALRILSLLGITRAEFARRLNAVTGQHYQDRDVAKWFGGKRPFPPAAVVWLRLAPLIERLQRRRIRQPPVWRAAGVWRLVKRRRLK